MCGIAGYVSFGGDKPSGVLLEAMADTLRHRGPDANGIFIDGPCGLAHTRLSIIDLQGSIQPMSPPDASVALVYNGELYNYLQLRQALHQAGQALGTQGDTEVVLRWVDREWERALPRFDGMFAFAAWQRAEERLLLARDPIGEKPLFYANPREGLLVFGSEPKALLAHPAVDDELDVAALRQVLRFRAVYGDRSLYGGIRQLEPGCYLEFTRRGVRSGRFHDLVGDARAARQHLCDLDAAELLRRGKQLLIESVRERCIADVPLGAFLSGGVDSSLIVAVMRLLRGNGESIQTFSVGFRDDPFSELPRAEAVAAAVGADHTEVHVSEEDYLEQFARLTACRDAPISEPADVAIAHMSRVARTRVKVVLSGEGADEVFAGYPKYLLAGAPWFVRRSIRLLGPQRVAWLAGMLRLNRRRALVAARALAPRRELDRLVQWFSYLDGEDLRGLLPGLDWCDSNWAATTLSQQSVLQRLGDCTPLARMQMVDCLNWLPGNMLERGDRMTMAEGLELRPPFLDKELVAFGLALPDAMKIRGGTGKWIARQWLAELLPAVPLPVGKWGFRVPLAQWFRGDLRPMLFDYLGNPRGLCGSYGDADRVRQLLYRHDDRSIDAELSLWTLLAAEVWYQDVYLKRRAARQSPVESVWRIRS